MLGNMPLSAPLCQKYGKDKPENKKSGYLRYVCVCMCVCVCVCVCKEWRRWDGMGIPLKEGSEKPRPHIKKQRHHFADKAIAFPVVMYR